MLSLVHLPEDGRDELCGTVPTRGRLQTLPLSGADVSRNAGRASSSTRALAGPIDCDYLFNGESEYNRTHCSRTRVAPSQISSTTSATGRMSFTCPAPWPT